MTAPCWTFGRIEMAGGGFVRTGQVAETAPLAGSVLLLTGRCEFMEKYAEQARDWAARGWRVHGCDWRGQGGSSRFLANRHKGHVPDFDCFLDDLSAVEEELIAAAPRPLVVFAHSMGGHVALRFAAEKAAAWDGLVLSAPMLGIRTIPERIAMTLARAMVGLGRGTAYAPGQLDYREELQRFDGNVLTSDPVRFRAALDAIGANPDLALGGITWGWLDAAYRSIDRLLKRDPIEQIRLPVLMLSAGHDQVVITERQAALVARLPNARQKLYPAAQHELMMEHDSIRALVWADIDEFLAEIAATGGAAG